MSKIWLDFIDLQPHRRWSWDGVLNVNKKQIHWFAILFNLWSVVYSTNTTYLMFKLTKKMCGGQIITHFDFDGFKRVGTGATKELQNAQNAQKHQIGTFYRWSGQLETSMSWNQVSSHLWWFFSNLLRNLHFRMDLYGNWGVGLDTSVNYADTVWN